MTNASLLDSPSVASTYRDRLNSLDIARGLVCVLMAIDHVRVYSGVPAGGPTAGVFFTRWVTHFVAPAFCFLAGTGAFLYGRKVGDLRVLSRFLLTRGALLVLLELTVIRFTWTFNLDYSSFVLAGVIWMLGWCMVLMSILVRLRPATVGWTGVGIMALQQLFGVPIRFLPESIRGAVGVVWEFIYPAGQEAWSGMAILYVIVPWVGVMAAGYGFGLIVQRDAAERRKFCVRVGAASTLAFVVLGAIAVSLGSAENGAPFVFRLLGQQKYPPSQLFLLMTLGPLLLFLPVAERMRGTAANALATFGRVPMFYYLLHIPLIHVSALLVNVIRSGATHQEWYGTAPFTSVPPDQRWSLGLLYLVFAIVILLLYPACRWFAEVKRRGGGWLRYV